MTAALRLILLVPTIVDLAAPASASYSNGHSFSQTLNNCQKPEILKTVKTAAPASNAMWLTHYYDARGKVSSVLDSDGSGVLDNRSYVYDKLGRLDSATGPFGSSGAQASADYKHDALGNIRLRNQGTSTATIAYDASNRVSTATIFGQNRTFSYDARGNTTNNGRYAFVYDFANQPTSQTGAVNATFAYDGNFKRVKEVRAGKTIYSVYSRQTGGLLYRDQATDVVKTDYVSVGGAALRLKKTGTGALVPDYTHFDLQGSAVAATDAAGAFGGKSIHRIDFFSASPWRESYRPYGRTRLDPPANANDAGYTGHLRDDATGLNYMQARYYDAAIGRFYSTDPIGYEDQLNLYAYVHNDPVNMFDPNGEASYLVSRPIGIGDNNHMFAVVVDDKTGEVVARYSYGPQRDSKAFPGQLVSATGTDNGTDRDDQAAWKSYSGDSKAAAEAGISVAKIGASDEAVMASGEAVNQALGTRDNPGDIKYAPITGPQSTYNYGNSNSAAYAVSDRAVKSENPNASQSLPSGTRNPGWGQSDHIPYCPGDDRCQ